MAVGVQRFTPKQQVHESDLDKVYKGVQLLTGVGQLGLGLAEYVKRQKESDRAAKGIFTRKELVDLKGGFTPYVSKEGVPDPEDVFPVRVEGLDDVDKTETIKLRPKFDVFGANQSLQLEKAMRDLGLKGEELEFKKAEAQRKAEADAAKEAREALEREGKSLLEREKFEEEKRRNQKIEELRLKELEQKGKKGTGGGIDPKSLKDHEFSAAKFYKSMKIAEETIQSLTPKMIEPAKSGIIEGAKSIAKSAAFEQYLMGKGVTGISSKILSDDEKRFGDAIIAWTNSKARDESGASVNPTEYVNSYRSMMPQRNDNKDSVSQKLRQRQSLMESMKNEGNRVLKYYGEGGGQQSQPATTYQEKEAPKAKSQKTGASFNPAFEGKSTKDLEEMLKKAQGGLKAVPGKKK